MSDEEEPPGLSASSLPAFAAYGIELEYMIVDSERLSVLPVADRLLGESGEVDRGLLGWSNELVLHVIEIKNRCPVASLSMLPDAFQSEVRHVNKQLQTMGARLMPGAMHPWMNPRSETRLWPHNNHAIYHAYERIFNTRSHGWANLQSMHINLPFSGDREFARLHAAIRLALPILPALAASSPIANGRSSGYADYRMHVYCHNAQSIPSIAGMVVPESVADSDAYRQHILSPMYRDLGPHDPDKLLQHEWLNSRGAIPRFDRDSIEIRVIDTQECPRADLAVAAATVALVRMLYDAGEDGLAAQQGISTAALAELLHRCVRDADHALIDNPLYLHLLGMPAATCTAIELWQRLAERMPVEHGGNGMLRTILQHGPLARRILCATGEDYSPARLQAIYRCLCDCLDQGTLFMDG